MQTHRIAFIRPGRFIQGVLPLLLLSAIGRSQEGPGRIVITPQNAIVVAGSSVTLTPQENFFTAGLNPRFNPGLVVWSTSDPTIASLGGSSPATSMKINAVSPGIATITASSGPFRGKTTVMVTAGALTAIAITPPTVSIPKGETQQFTATGTFSSGPQQNITASVTWTSGDTSKATISNSPGSQGVATGVSITATAVTIAATSGSVFGTAQLSVTNPVVLSVSVAPSTASIAKGLTKQFNATAHLSDGTTQDITSAAGVTWTSLNTAAATMDPATLGLAHGVGVGSAGIQASFSGKSGQGTLTVTAAALQSIAVTPADPTINAGSTKQFTATGTFTDGTTQNLTNTVAWKSGTASVASITATGLATGISGGTSNISATQSGISGSTMLTVNPPVTMEGLLYVAGKTANAVYSWNAASTVASTTSPTRTISAVSIGFGRFSLAGPQGVFIEPASDTLYVVNANSPAGFSVFNTASTATGTATPARQVFGLALASNFSGIAVDPIKDILYLTDLASGGAKIRVWDKASTLNGNVAENRDISGLSLPEAVFDDPANDRLYVADFQAANISIYDGASAKTGSGTTRKLSGSMTKLTSPAGVTVDLIKDFLYVSDANTNSILIWKNASTVTGNIAPTAIITGASTLLTQPCHLAVDFSRDQLYVGSFNSNATSVLVFNGVSALSGTNNLAPARTITSPSKSPCGVAIDLARQ
jgi:6-phosphogluconolactonase (cycloisomerase 2 family)